MRDLVRVVTALLRASLLVAMQYRSDFLFDAVTGFVRTAASVAPLLVVYGQVDTVRGWAFDDALLVMSLFLVMQGLIGGLVEPNLGEVVDAIREGTLDLVLLKPADAQLLSSVRRVDPSALWDLFAGLGLAGWALSHRSVAVVDLAIAAVMVVCGLISIYGLWLFAICLSFWFVRVDNLRFLLEAVASAGQWPVSVFSGWVRFFLTFVVPVAIITSFPALAVRGLWDGELVLTAMATAALFGFGSRLAWLRSLASYTSASS